MACITVSLDAPLKERVERFSWVNWSEVAKEEILKREMFGRYLKTGELTDADWEFCEKINWHPVDELPLREEYKAKLEERRKGPFKTLKSVSEIFQE